MQNSQLSQQQACAGLESAMGVGEPMSQPGECLSVPLVPGGTCSFASTYGNSFVLRQMTRGLGMKQTDLFFLFLIDFERKRREKH